MTLSGAGPSVLLITGPEVSEQEIGEAVSAATVESTEVVFTSIANYLAGKRA